MPMRMESGAQTVPTSFLDSIDPNSSSCVPDFDMFLRDSEVPSPSNLYQHSFFDTPDYLLLSSLEESCLLLSSSSDCVSSTTSSSTTTNNTTGKPTRSGASPESPILRETLAKPSAPLRDHDHRLLAPQLSSGPSDESVAMLESLATAVSQVLVKQEPFEVSTSSVACQGLDCSSSSVVVTESSGGPKRSGAAPASVVVKQEQSLMEDYYCDQMMDLDSLEEVQSLVMKQLAKDIDAACTHLGISADPMNWSCDDVRTWLLWTLRQYNLPMIRLEYFQMDGAALCYQTEYNFKQRSAQCGEVLFAQLELWKAACQRIPERAPSAAPSPPPAKAVFKPEDSLLDMSSYFQWPMTASPMATPPREGSISPDSATAAVVPDSSSTGISSDYGSDGGLQSDDDASEDGLDPTEKPARHNSSHSHIHLWQFLKELLLHPQLYSSCIRWLDRTKGVFKIEDSVRVARLWGKRKNRPAMNYDKLSRSIRQYYKKGIMKKTERSQRLVYQFCHPYCL